MPAPSGSSRRVRTTNVTDDRHLKTRAVTAERSTHVAPSVKAEPSRASAQPARATRSPRRNLARDRSRPDTSRFALDDHPSAVVAAHIVRAQGRRRPPADLLLRRTGPRRHPQSKRRAEIAASSQPVRPRRVRISVVARGHPLAGRRHHSPAAARRETPDLRDFFASPLGHQPADDSTMAASGSRTRRSAEVCTVPISQSLASFASMNACST